MKKKFLVFTLCFTLIFSSFNYKKTYAFDGGIISAPMLGVVATVAIGSGLIINSSEDIINLGNNFYNHYKDNISQVKEVFDACVSIGANKVVTVGSDFLEYVKSFFDFMFSNSDSVGPIGYYQGIPVFSSSLYAKCVNPLEFEIKKDGVPFKYGSFEFYNDGSYTWGYHNGNYALARAESTQLKFRFCLVGTGTTLYMYNVNSYGRLEGYVPDSLSIKIPSPVSFSSQGSYNWDNVSGKLNDDNSVSVYVPGNLGSLVGDSSLDVFNNPSYELPNDGIVSIPNVDNPSISVDSSISIPGVNSPDIPGVDSPSVPNEGIWATIKDFIVGLVVPSDSYWTDTWGGLYNNFTNSFPMVDMDGFNDLVTGEKKFPNIDINIMGVSGRVVNGDVINSIVDWLRPIIAGFMMLCLMLFNYRKIYKLIRNTEPFGGIAPGTSDFRTGISEYKHDYITPTGLSMPYQDYLEHSKTQRKWEMANPGKDYGEAGFTKVD